MLVYNRVRRRARLALSAHPRRTLAAVGRRLPRDALSLLGLLLSGCDLIKGKPSFKSIDITGAEYARELSLKDPSGRVRSLAEFKGQVVLVFFGYTQCPDVCPSTLAEVAEIRRSLGEDGRRMHTLFVSLDPARDTPTVLQAYAENFGEGVTALTGSEEEVRAAAKSFKVFFSQVPGKSADTYTLDHTAGTYVFDPHGRVRLFSRYGAPAAGLAEDIRALLKGA